MEHPELNIIQYILMPVNNKTKTCQYKILLMDPIVSQFSPFHFTLLELNSLGSDFIHIAF